MTSNPSPFQEWMRFNASYQSLVGKISEADKQKELPTCFKIHNEINRVNKAALDALEAWKEIPDSRLGKIRKKLTFFSQFGALSPFLRLVGVKKEKLKPKESAEAPFKFEEATESEKKSLLKKTKFLKIIATVVLVASGIVIFSAMTLPILSVTFLIKASLAVAATVLIGTTIISALGTTSLFVYPLLINNKITKESRLKSDPSFKLFIQIFGESPSQLNMNFSKKNVYDSDIHGIYLKWSKNMSNVLSMKNLEKAKVERDKYIASRP